MSERHEIAGRLRAAREAAGWTQDELAARLDVAKSAISRMESGERGLAASELAAISTILEVPVDVLLFGTARDEVLLRAEGDAAAAVAFAHEVVEDIEFIDALLA